MNLPNQIKCWFFSKTQTDFKVFLDSIESNLKADIPCQRTWKKNYNWKGASKNCQPLILINRPGVAGAVLQTTLSLIDSISQSFFSSQSSKYNFSQTVKARTLTFIENFHHPLCVKCHMSGVTCHMSCVMWHMTSLLPNRYSYGPEILRHSSSLPVCHKSHVMCHGSHVMCHMYLKKKYYKWMELVGEESAIIGAYPV